MSVEAEHGLDLIPNSPIVRETYGFDDATPEPSRMAKPIVDDAIPYDAVWDCVTCGACVEACPVLIEHVDKIVGLRRNLVLEESRFPSELTGAFRAMEGQGNPWGQPASTRTDWTKGLLRGADRRVIRRRARPPRRVGGAVLGRLRGRVRRAQPAWSPGHSRRASTRPASGSRSSVRRSRARATRLGGWATTTSSRSCQRQRRHAEPLRDGERTIVTACPHCFNTIANEYGQLGGSFRVVHHSVFLQGLLADGRLRVADDGAAGPVTLHDSCYLTRYNGVVEAPRDILGSVPGLELLEMEGAASRRWLRRGRMDGWRRRCGRGSTRSGRVRRWRPARQPS